MTKPNWHTLAAAEVFALLRTSESGLEDKEAATRNKRFGANVLPQAKPYSSLRLFLNQFNNPLIYLLLAAAAISLYLRHHTDAVFILAVVIINTGVSFYQEHKADKTLWSLKKLVKTKTRVRRGGGEKELDSEELTPGDIVLFRAGDKVPADGRILQCKELKINESSLTGEWKATAKQTQPLAEKTVVADRDNMVFMGTVVEEGFGEMAVVAVGLQTEMGEIVSLIRERKEQRTPLQKNILWLSRLVGVFVLAAIFLVILLGYWRGHRLGEILVASLALAASAIPAGLLPAITVILVLGMQRILKRNGLVRKLVATETLGSVTVICTDKTGTLTEGKMQVSRVLTSTKELMADGDGRLIKPVGSREEWQNGLESHITALKIAVMASDAFIENPADELHAWIVRGRSTEQALVLAGAHAGLSKKELDAQHPLLDRIHFNSDHKYAAALRRQNKKTVLYLVGAPEVIIQESSYLDVDGRRENITGPKTRKLLRRLDELSAGGLRVVACAYREFQRQPRYKHLEDQVRDLTLAGFIALQDPLRADVTESIRRTQKAGVRTVLVTGDHLLTARAVAKEIGLPVTERTTLHGGELENMSDEILVQRAKTVNLYARVSPRHKLRIVDALQTNKETVAMVGDGVNDAPALRAADIGVAVSGGSDVTKEVAELVLLDNSFGTIVKAVEQGRIIWQNIRKVFVYLIADDFSELVLFLTALSLNWPVPLLAAQILWINLIEDALPGLALSTEQESIGVMERHPPKRGEHLINTPIRRWLLAILIIGGLAAAAVFGTMWRVTGDLPQARTAVFALIALDSLLLSFIVRSFHRPIWRRNIFSNLYLTGGAAVGVLLLLGAVYWPPLQKILSTVPLGPVEWLIIIGVNAAEVVLLEWSKAKIFRAEAGSGTRTRNLSLTKRLLYH